jgi:hypothetical protein
VALLALNHRRWCRATLRLGSPSSRRETGEVARWVQWRQAAGDCAETARRRESEEAS